MGKKTTPAGDKRATTLILRTQDARKLCRNYLRRSRHLESGIRGDGCSSLSNVVVCEAEGIRNVYTVAPRDILSFAWQISKGMAYLADIKVLLLVHLFALQI